MNFTLSQSEPHFSTWLVQQTWVTCFLRPRRTFFGLKKEKQQGPLICFSVLATPERLWSLADMHFGNNARVCAGLCTCGAAFWSLGNASKDWVAHRVDTEKDEF